MPARREIEGVPEDRVAKLKRWLRSEVTQKDKVAANLGLAKAAGLFFGSVLVFTYFGEAFNV